jgi:hypothetical protein
LPFSFLCLHSGPFCVSGDKVCAIVLLYWCLQLLLGSLMWMRYGPWEVSIFLCCVWQKNTKPPVTSPRLQRSLQCVWGSRKRTQERSLA